MTLTEPLDLIPRPREDALPWEKLSVALVDILGGVRQIVTVDELKRADVALGNSYRGLSSFERLTQAAVNVLVSKGMVDEGDLRVRMARLAVTLAGDKDRTHLKARFSNAGVNDIGGCRAARSIDATTTRRAGRSLSSRSGPCCPGSGFAPCTNRVARPRSWATTTTASPISSARRKRRRTCFAKRAC